MSTTRLKKYSTLKCVSLKLSSIVVAIVVSFALTACGTNPVTKKKEFQLVSQSQEISIGKQNYSPARQSQGGDYVIDPELTAYVQSVGNRLAKVSDRPELPYEFVVINDSVPNAWAMPGGKIAFNRGLLYELNSEAELAAVLGHEITHAAARHGAKSMERGIFMQGAMIAIGLSTQNNNYRNLIVGGSQLGAQLVSSKYGRDAEKESDLYGMQYMKKAGYDPAAAVTLQETFVRLSAGRESNFITGLFASHPPSPERVAANKITLTQVGAGGEMGKEIYAQKVGKLKAGQPAYKAYDDGVKALNKNDSATALADAKKAVALEPREARFQELLGDIEMQKKRPIDAILFYAKAIQLQPDYFKPHIQTGVALFNLGRKAEAEPYLKRANELLPTAPGHALLGQIAEERGDMDNALQHYQVASESNSDIGKQANARAVQIDLPRHPAKYIQSGAIVDNAGNVFAAVQNDTNVPIGRVQVRVVKYDAATGRAVGQSQPMIINGVQPSKQNQIAIGERVKTAQEAQLYRVVVEAAELAR